MKLIVTVEVPSYKERDVKIADLVDSDQLLLRKMAESFILPPDSKVSVEVDYLPLGMKAPSLMTIPVNAHG